MAVGLHQNKRMKNVSDTRGEEVLIRAQVEDWTAAVRARNLDGILKLHRDDFVLYDVPPPFQSVGIEAYARSWETFFTGTRPGVFDLHELHLVAGDSVAFGYASLHCEVRNPDGSFSRLDFRLTIGLQKIGTAWWFVHEHHSIPAV